MSTKSDNQSKKPSNEKKKQCCTKECTENCCKRFATAAAYSLANFVCIFAYTLMWTFIFQKFMNIDFLYPNLLFRDGPVASPVSPGMSCLKDGTRKFCSEQKLGAVRLDKCNCTANDYAASLFVELLKQEKLKNNLNTANFSGTTSTTDRKRAQDDIQFLIDSCTQGGVSRLVENVSNGVICYLISLNRIINWVPEVELVLDGVSTDDVEAKLENEIGKRREDNATVNITRNNEMQHSILLWTLIIREEVHKGKSYEDAVIAANSVLSLPAKTNLFRLDKRSLEDVLYEDTRMEEEISISEYKRFASLANRTDYELRNYLPVVCNIMYKEVNMSANVQVFPAAGIFVPSYQVYNGKTEDFIDSLFGFMLPRNTFGKGKVLCTVMAGNINYLDTDSGNTNIPFHFYA